MWRACLVASIGCYGPHPHAGVACASGAACPDGLVCSPASQTCEPVAIDAPLGTPSDAPSDAPVISLDAPMATVQLVQEGVNSADTGTTLSLSLPVRPVAGHLLIMCGAGVFGGIASVSGGGVATWSLATRSLTNSNVEIWYGITDAAVVPAPVTIAITSNSSPLWMNVSEWSGMATANVLDAATSTSGVVSPADAGSITTTNARDLVIFGVGDGTPNTFGTPTPQNWNALTPIAAAFNQGEWYRVTTAAARFDPHVSETDGGWDAAIAAFRAAP